MNKVASDVRTCGAASFKCSAVRPLWLAAFFVLSFLMAFSTSVLGGFSMQLGKSHVFSYTFLGVRYSDLVVLRD